jgi:hypothetical protein
MFNNYAFEDFGHLLEADEADESYFNEADEASPRGGRGRGPSKPLPKPSRGNAVPQQPAAGYATKAELQATANKLDARIGTVSKGMEALDKRTRSIEGEHARMAAALRREISERRAAVDSLKRAVDDTRNISMLLPLLSSTETATVGGVDNVVVDNGDSFSKVLPILLLSGGLGGSSTPTAPGQPSSGGGALGFGDNNVATLALVLALAGPKK